MFLITEIHQDTTTMEASAYQERSSELIQLNIGETESEPLLAALSKLDFPMGLCNFSEKAINSLTPLELTAFKHYIAANLFRVQNLYAQFEYGLLTETALRPAMVSLTFYARYTEHLNLPQQGISNSILEQREVPDIPEGWCFGARAVDQQNSKK